MWTVHIDLDIDVIKDFAEVMRQMGNWHAIPTVTTLVIRAVQRFLRKTDENGNRTTHFTKYEDADMKQYIVWKYSNGISLWRMYAWGMQAKTPALDLRKACIIFAREVKRFLLDKGQGRCYALVPTFTNQLALDSWLEFDKLMDVERTPIKNSIRWHMRLDKLKVAV